MKNIPFKKILNSLKKKNIAIIGHMGSGKSVFGLKIAEYFNTKHIDTDKEIIKYENNSINNIFTTKGEGYFRDIETKIVINCLKKSNVIISLGGGSILKKEVRDLIYNESFSLFLDVDINILAKRLKKSKNRPLLKSNNVLTTIKKLDIERRKHYLNANLIIDNSGSPKKTILKFITIFSSLND
tara:strand:- start:115 stop:666 length:552 start_codon:yes stop_codon:yes gene_type:complete